jgi:DNA-binding CsgD family transcriptional regulator
MRPPKSRPSPAEETERVERAAGSLSPLERDVLVLSAGQRLRNAEIAARLGISERRAERLLARALRKFSRGMEGPAFMVALVGLLIGPLVPTGMMQGVRGRPMAMTGQEGAPPPCRPARDPKLCVRQAPSRHWLPDRASWK